MGLRRLGLFALAGCGRLGFDLPGEDGDGRIADGGWADGPGACSAWSTPQPVLELNSTSAEFEVAISPDGTWIALVSTRSSIDTELYLASVSGGVIGTPQRLSAPMNSVDNDDGPMWDPTGQTFYFSTNRAGGPYLYRASFVDGVFGTPAEVPELVGREVYGPTFSSDGLEMFFSSGWDAASRIWRATRGSVTDPWQQIRAVNELAGLPAGWPSLSPDGMMLYIEGNTDMPQGQLYVVTRTAVGGPFSAPTKIISDGTSRDGDPFITNDGQTLWFSSDRGGATHDIYATTRTCL